MHEWFYVLDKYPDIMIYVIKNGTECVGSLVIKYAENVVLNEFQNRYNIQLSATYDPFW